VSLLRTWFAAGLFAALILAVFELAALGSGAPDLVIAAIGLLAALGFVIGGAVWLPPALLGARRVHPLAGALIRAAPALPPLIHLGGHLFDGARAAELPLARGAFLWVPAAGYLAIALATLVGVALLRDGRPGRRVLVAVPLFALVTLLEIANRRLFVSGYPDLHLFLTLATASALTLGIGVLVGAGRPRSPEPAAVVAWSLSAALVSVGLLLALFQGLGSKDSRSEVAEDGVHTRHLVRVARAAIDLDGDGFSPVLGGGDCDDGDPTINPGAADIPGDGIDQDCDGADLEVAPAEPVGPEDPEGTWRASPARAPVVERTRGMNVLFVSVDALRADAVGRPHTPRLDALLARSLRFSRAWSPGAGTDLSLGAVVTGRIDPWTTVETTLIERLADAGRATHAILPREVLRYAGRTLVGRGLGGLDEIINDREQRDVSSSTSSIETTDRALVALDRLAARSAPFFLWVHYFDAHEHKQVENDDAALVSVAAPFDLATRAGKYGALVALVDREVGRLLDGLASRGVADETIVVLFGDHGESLGEDPRLPDNHGLLVYEPLVRIPLAIAVPGVPGAEHAVPVSLLDLPVTVLDLLDLEPLPGYFGRSLAPLVAADAPADLFVAPRALPLNESEQWAVVRWPLKLLVRPADNLVELYDLEADPREARDLSPGRPDDVAALKSLRAGFPPLDFDRTSAGRRRREALARPPRTR
jgi:arylsulfatase A-like enzyme